MSNLIKDNSNLAEGSVFDTSNSQGVKPEDVLANCDVIVMLDISGSMDAFVYGANKNRWEAAVDQLRLIQRTFPGRVALIQFGGMVTGFRFNGIPDRPTGSTPMHEAMAIAHDFDNQGKQFYLISDGQPDRVEIVHQWAKAFVSPINTIFIGDDNDISGIRLLGEVSRFSGGEASGKLEPQMLGEAMKLLITRQ